VNASPAALAPRFDDPGVLGPNQVELLAKQLVLYPFKRVLDFFLECLGGEVGAAEGLPKRHLFVSSSSQRCKDLYLLISHRLVFVQILCCENNG